MVVAQVVCAMPNDAGGTTNTFGSTGPFPTVPANTWTEVTGTITVPAGCTSVSLAFGQNGGSGTAAGDAGAYANIFVDDVFVGM
jgi:hypothetical protein